MNNIFNKITLYFVEKKINNLYKNTKVCIDIFDEIERVIKLRIKDEVTLNLFTDKSIIKNIKLSFKEEEIEIPNKEKKTEVDDPELIDYLEQRDPNDLTYEDMIHIIKLYDSGYYYQKDIGRFFKISVQKVHRIVNDNYRVKTKIDY